MNIVPFGHNVLLWRSRRHLTQAQLARRCGIPQPNLSAIERGARDLSLRSLRALAASLQVRPGVLVDGIPPPALDAQAGPPAPRQRAGQAGALERGALERIAAAAAGRRVSATAGEREVAELLKPLVRGRLQAAGRAGTLGKPGARAVRLSWMTLRARYADAVIDSLIQRVSEHESPPD